MSGSMLSQGENKGINLKLPPRPEILKNKINPFYEKEGSVVTEGYTLPKAQMDKLFHRLSSSEPSKQLQLHDIYVEEVVRRGTVIPKPDASLVDRLYTKALAARQKTTDSLTEKYLSPLAASPVLPRDAIDDLVQRNYERFVKKK